MNMNCVMCGKSVSSFPGYVTDGIICVCDKCAASNSLMRVVTRIENVVDKSNLISVFSEPIEVDSGHDQNETADMDSAHDQNEASDTYSGHDQNEIELAHDIDNMSHDDFFSKYADNPSALSAYIDANGEPDDVVISDANGWVYETV